MKQSGYIALTSVIVIMGVILALTATVSLLSLGEAQSAFALNQGESTLQFVEGCMEDALIKAKQNSGYNGGTITRPEGTCQITVAKNNTIWTITATNSVNSFKRTIQTVINRTAGGITLTSWKEL